MSDPRVFFAAERTLLAWVRSGITFMALGFVVAKFGLFLNLLQASNGLEKVSTLHHILSSGLGIILVLIGSFIALGAEYNHRNYIKTLPPEDLPTLKIYWLTPFLSLSVLIAGILLSIFLAFS